jgi:hypothetical protein
LLVQVYVLVGLVILQAVVAQDGITDLVLVPVQVAKVAVEMVQVRLDHLQHRVEQQTQVAAEVVEIHTTAVQVDLVLTES